MSDLTSSTRWTTTDDVDICAVLAEAVTEITGCVADAGTAERIIGYLRECSYDVVPSPTYDPERFTPPF